MKKTGFTLQEFLIALAIIGVIAALTVPALSTHFNKKLWATSLSAAVSNFENAMSTMIMKDGATDLFGTKAWKLLEGGMLSDEGGPADEFMKAVSGSLPLVSYVWAAESFMDDENSGYYDGVGNVLNDKREEIYSIPILGESVLFYTKGGVIYYVYIENSDRDPNAIKESEALANGVNLTAEAAKIAIDVNGDRNPNIIGRDIFFFILGADGILYPYGSNDVNNKLGEEYTCKNNRGMGCTAELIDNNYKMDY